MSSKSPKAGEQLGRGSYKQCYSLPGNMVGLANYTSDDYNEDTDIYSELQRIKRLERLGLPVPPSHIGSILVEGKKVDALIMPRYKHHNRDVCYNSCEGWDGVVTKALLYNLEQLFFVLKRKRLDIGDFQFLIDGRGRVFICDPLNVYRNQLQCENETMSKIANFIGTYAQSIGYDTKLTTRDFNLARQCGDDSL